MPRVRAALLSLAVLSLFILLPACAARREPLPGDHAASDGALFPSAVPSGGSARVPSPPGAIESRLFAPELIMEHQARIGLAAPQREAILGEVERGQAEMLRLKWDLQAQKQELARLLDDARVDEPQVMAQAAKVMALEDQLKTVHLRLLVRIKNRLEKGQQSRLRQLRDGREARAAGVP